MSTKKLTTKKTKISTSKTKENPERHLIEGANILMNEFKTPAKFLSFLTDALYWTSEEGISYEKGTNRTFFIRLLIREVLQPWLEGGEDMLKRICKGLDEVAGCGEYEEYYNCMAKIMKGFAVSMLPDLYEPDYLCERLSYIQAMLRIGDCAKLYDDEMNKIGEEKLSKAA